MSKNYERNTAKNALINKECSVSGEIDLSLKIRRTGKSKK